MPGRHQKFGLFDQSGLVMGRFDTRHQADAARIQHWEGPSIVYPLCEDWIHPAHECADSPGDYSDEPE